MKVSDFNYHLPPERIAQKPPDQRDAARLLVLHPSSGQTEHHTIRDLPGLLRSGDLLVLNNTRVLPARVMARKSTGGKVELLFLEERNDATWEVLLRASRRPAVGDRLLLEPGETELVLVEDGELGRAVVRVESREPTTQLLEELGQPPLPPYIKRDEGDPLLTDVDRERYQTVYATEDGAVAAPTAGLHFTPELFEALHLSGIQHTTITLHVGLGTFRPVSVERVQDHEMEGERYVVTQESADRINETRRAGGRIIAVGSTSVRTLETVAEPDGTIVPGEGRSSLFIYPPYTFKAVDGMLTNFHLPQSTLLMMIAALAGREVVMRAYQEAIEKEYRFYSYGDAMLILE